MKTLIIGLGNPILTDDGVGVKVAYAIEDELSSKETDNITVTEASVGGLRLMEMMVGYDRVILVDAMIKKNGKPGTIHKLTIDDLRDISPTQHSASSHDTTLVTALDMGHQLGMPLPKEIVIYAIEVENVLDFNDQPTAAVAAAIPRATKAVLEELQK